MSEKYGSAEYAVVPDKDGNPVYDRPVYREAPSMNMALWGIRSGVLVIGLILEARPHADYIPGTFHDSGNVKFWGVPKGFRDPGETAQEAAVREAGEEAGVRVVKSAEFLGEVNANPTFLGTTTTVLAIEADLEALGVISPQRGERIYKAKFFTVPEVMAMVRNGIHEDGHLADGLSLGVITKFIAWKNLIG